MPHRAFPAQRKSSGAIAGANTAIPFSRSIFAKEASTMSEQWYSKRTQVFWTCRALLAGRTITHLDEIGETRGWRLGAIIHNLRTRYGWPIDTDNRGPERIAHYRLCDGCNAMALELPRSARSLRGNAKDVPRTVHPEDDSDLDDHGGTDV